MSAVNSDCRDRFPKHTETVESVGTEESRCFFLSLPSSPHTKGVSEEERVCVYVQCTYRKETGFQSESVEVFVLNFGEHFGR